MVCNVNYLVRLRSLRLPQDITRRERRAAARKHRAFPLYTMPKDLVNSFSYNLPLLWLALYFDKAEAGLFALALTFCVRPVNVLNSAFERIFYVRTMERVRQRQPVGPELWRFVGGLSAVCLPLLTAAFLFAEPLFCFCFGARWTGCAYYVRCLLPWAFVMLSSTSLSFVASVFNRQRGEFFFFLALLALRAAALYVGISPRLAGIFLFALVAPRSAARCLRGISPVRADSVKAISANASPPPHYPLPTKSSHPDKKQLAPFAGMSSCCPN